MISSAPTMPNRYDVIVAGAGPAGAQCARDLAERGYKVVVLETEAEAKFPAQSNKSTGGTFASMMTSFGIQDDVVMHATESVVLESPNEHFIQDQPGFVLDFEAFKKFLVEDGRHRGAEYRFGARVRDPIVEDGDVVGVRYNSDQEVYGEIVIDATGPAAPLAKNLGIANLERKNHAIGIEYLFEGVDLTHPDFADLTDAMMLRLDHEYVPGGTRGSFIQVMTQRKSVSVTSRTNAIKKTPFTIAPSTAILNTGLIQIHVSRTPDKSQIVRCGDRHIYSPQIR